MFARLRRRLGLSPIAFGLVLAIGVAGSAGAAAKLITGKQIKDNSLTGKDVKDGSLLAKDFAKGQLPAGATGPAGPAGPTGPKGDPSFAVTTIVSPAADGAASGARLKAAVDAAAASGKRSLVWLEPGDYEVSGTLDLGAEVSLAGVDINSTQITMTPAGSNCGVIAPSTYGVIRDVELSVVGACGIQMAGPNDSLRIHDARISLSPESAALAATIRLASTGQNLRIDGAELDNLGSGTGATVILAQSASPFVRVSDSALSLSGGGSGSAGIAMSGSAGLLNLVDVFISTNRTAVGLSGGSTVRSRDSRLESTAGTVLTANTSGSNQLIGGSVAGGLPAATVPATIECVGVFNSGGSATAPLGSACQ